MRSWQAPSVPPGPVVREVWEGKQHEREQQGSRVLTESQVSTEQKHKIKIQRSGGPSSFADDRS